MKTFFKWLGRIVCCLLLLLIVGGTALTLYCHHQYAQIIEKEPVAQKVAALKQKEGYVPLEEMSDYYLEAVVAVEDHRFYDHGGIDPLALVRIFFDSVRAGHIVGGGSTITQQLCKNIYLSQEQTITRKITEVFFALEVEKELSKDEILELYCNDAYFGNNCYGIGQASAYYYQKAPADLTLEEATFLAGLPQAPSYFADNPDQGRQRQEEVLDAMVKYGYLSESDRPSLA
ncbi:transglycosylase domain-containing protein [Neobittarella massiliensis]|uniref:Penicillin-binding protein 1A n=1 Tax=Neobittarella massiliensis (ex Bilen et al. 2018) TaxID=2041842 RepID=A0A8J6IN84_9FIRM|nr:transglycosylase domain-containing protein [Neobittarella massiliensis]